MGREIFHPHTAYSGEDSTLFSFATLILIAVVTLIIGIAIGFFAQKHYGSPSAKQRDMEQQLAAAEQRLTEYQSEVTETFAETARRVNKLTASYKDVHDHLANSAMKLTSATVSQQFLTADRVTSPATEEDDTGLDGNQDRHAHKSGSEYGPEQESDEYEPEHDSDIETERDTPATSKV